MLQAADGLRFHHGAASVPDLDAAIDWHGHVRGFAVETRFPIPQARARVAMLERDGMRIEPFQVDGAQALPPERLTPPTDLPTRGNKNLAFGVADLAPVPEEF